MSTMRLHVLILSNNLNHLTTYSINDIHMIISSRIDIDYQVYLIEIKQIVTGIPTQPSGIRRYICPPVDTK